MSRSDEPGWQLCSMHDPAKRRGIWFRRVDTVSGFVESLEVCGGREGDDWYVKLEADKVPTGHGLFELFSALDTGRWMLEDFDGKEPF